MVDKKMIEECIKIKDRSGILQDYRWHNNKLSFQGGESEFKAFEVAKIINNMASINQQVNVVEGKIGHAVILGDIEPSHGTEYSVDVTFTREAADDVPIVQHVDEENEYFCQQPLVRRLALQFLLELQSAYNHTSMAGMFEINQVRVPTDYGTAIVKLTDADYKWARKRTEEHR